MPMNRYEIRDEYSLADPELYRAADKDDPEALLEGVAMAGMVGVLRQLGDLAEFAAEIFHDLHEEVMVTAVRGHNLMTRVQQLEAEVPSVEKALLSQTDLSSVFYNTGVDWHANLRLEQNLVTQGDLPRFVMDSYEECRGPPRLFLLDKFDVAGAGACLKRYTDPSFFKVETSATANVNVQREKKIRKAKKKGSRARYGETPERLQPSPHAKLHQLLLEECVENGVAKPAYRARLKRRPTAFPFNLKSGKSYMEELLKNPSPGHKMLHEIPVSSPLQMSIDDQNESVLELRSVSPARESEVMKSNPPFPEREEIIPNPFLNQTNGASADVKTYGVSSLINILTDDIRSTSDEEIGGKDITIDGESKLEGSLKGYQSDEVASEIDNYVDAPSTMESEMDTDSELRVKDNVTSYKKNQTLASVKNQERCHSLSLDSQSTGDLSISDEGNNSYKKEMSSSLSSDSPSTSAENPQAEKLSANGFPSADNDIPEFVRVNASSAKGSPTLPRYDSRAVALEGSLRGAKSDETVSNSDDSEKKGDLILDSQYSPNASSKSLGDDSQRPSSGVHLDGEIPWASRSADISHHTSDSLDAISDKLVHEDDQKDLNQFESIPSTLNMDNNAEEIGSKENLIPGTLDNGVTKLTDYFANNNADIAHDGDNIASEVSEGDERDQSSDFNSEDPNIVSETLESEDRCFDQTIAHDKDFIQEGPMATDGTSEVGNTETSEDIGLQLGTTDAVNSSNLTAPESSFCMPETLEDSSGIAALQVTEISSSATLRLPSQIPDSLDELDPSTDQSENARMACSIPAISDNTILENVVSPGGINILVEEHVPSVKDSSVLEDDAAVLSGFNSESEVEEEERRDVSGNHSESGLVEEVDEREAAELDFAAVCRMKHDDHPEQEVSHTYFSSHLDSEVKHRVDMVNASQILTPLEQSGLDTEEESCNQIGVENLVSDVDSLYVGSVAEESILPENIELRSAPVDDALPDSSEIMSSELSSVSPTSQLQMLDHDNDNGFDSYAFPPPVSVLPGLGDYGADTSAYPKGPSGFMFPPEINQMNQHLSPSLPPLPPLQWRIGKLQHASSSTEADKMEIKQLFPEASLPPETSTGDVSSEPEQTKQSPPQSPRITIEEANAMQEPISLPQKIEIEQESEVPSPAEEVEIAEGSQMVELPVQIVPQSALKEEENEQNQAQPSQQQQLLNPTKESEVPSPAEEVEVAEGSQMVELHVQIVPQSALKEEENEQNQAQPSQQQLLNPTKESEVPSPAEEVEVAEGSQMVELPVQIVPQSALKEEENEQNQAQPSQQQLLNPTKESEVPSPAEEVEVAEGSQMVELPVLMVPQSALEEEEKEQQKQQLHLVLPIEEGLVPSPAVEDGVANGYRTIKLPRTCNPVIGSVAALDKSRLRKVTEQARPQKQKQDERDALLDQIRAKSFNLKPTATTKPSIQGPNTNLKLAAILEKANAIRQALAGSDEDDDDDSWSDS